MKEDLFSAVHYSLMQHIDGPAADIFSAHVAPLVGDPRTINRRYSVGSQIQWLSMYWMQQIFHLGARKYNAEVSKLINCRDYDDFMDVFNNTIMPILQAEECIPHCNIAIPPIVLETKEGRVR